ncbi:MAG: DNA primase [Actinomycetota bacterium]|nr:DNA primase [Actinomycetota bacterium]
MARIKDASIEAVRQAADIVAVVSGRTNLRKAGARHVGLCPFHDERTPSFSVSADKGTYHCFGCGAGGDTVRFVEETEGVGFVGAIEWLADRFNVPLEYEEFTPGEDERRRKRDRLFTLLDHAARFYERYLWDSPTGREAREYLAGRGLREEVCREFRLGLAVGGATLARKAVASGFTNDELLAAGLVNRRGNDFFSGRLVFPLADARGRVVGFSARKLREDDPLRAKYVNSPESELFHKSAILYGLHLARGAIAKQDRAVIVEGNPDVIALRQAGLEAVVAPMGTALTERQLRELARLTHRVWLCFDADAAGEAATLRGMELAAAQGFEIRVVTLPEGLDPADAAEGFEERLASAASFVLHRVRLELDRTADRQEAFVRAREILSRFEDSPERQDAIRLVADRLDLPPETQAGLAPRGSRATGTVSRHVLAAGDRLERSALAGCVAHPELASHLAELSPDLFDSDLHRRAREHLLEPREADPEVAALLAELDARAEAEGIDLETAKQLLLRLRERDLRRQLSSAEPERAKELQTALLRLREAVGHHA